MYPTLMAGLGLLAASILYSRRPERRFVPLMLTLGLFTLFAGSLGFVTGVATCLRYYAAEPNPVPITLTLGVMESLNNVVLALTMSVLASLFASVGAFRLSRQTQPAPAR
jgi:hypothetical protein